MYLFFTAGTNISKVLGIIRNLLTTFQQSNRTTFIDLNSAKTVSRPYR